MRDRRFWTDERQAADAAVDPLPEDPPAVIPVKSAAPEIDVERLRAALAELEDAKHRLRRDAERQADLLRARVLESLLPVLDNLDRSIAAAEAVGSGGALLDGVRIVRTQFLTVLADYGLERVNTVGQKFDPRVHDAVSVVPVDDPMRDGIVVAEFEPAYRMGDRIVRAAKVQVGRAAYRPPA